MFLFESKTKKNIRGINENLETYFNMLKQTLEDLNIMVGYILKSENKYLEESVDSIHLSEHKADLIKKDIENKLDKMELQNEIKSEYYKLLNILETIPDIARESSLYIFLLNPKIPDFLIEIIKTIMKDTMKAMDCLIESFDFVKKDEFDFIIKYMEKIHALEEKVDGDEWKSINELFKSDKDLEEKLALKKLIHLLALISNKIEDSADKFEIYCIKRTQK